MTLLPGRIKFLEKYLKNGDQVTQHKSLYLLSAVQDQPDAEDLFIAHGLKWDDLMSTFDTWHLTLTGPMMTSSASKPFFSLITPAQSQKKLWNICSLKTASILTPLFWQEAVSSLKFPEICSGILSTKLWTQEEVRFSFENTSVNK